MKTSNILPDEVAALIPYIQLTVTKFNLQAFEKSLKRLALALQVCPDILRSDYSKGHRCIFHYFHGETDIFICEYDKKDTMYGYTIFNGDVQNAEWGFTHLSEIRNIPFFNIDYYFPEQTIEEALYKAYPNYYINPNSLHINVCEEPPDFYRTALLS